MMGGAASTDFDELPSGGHSRWSRLRREKTTTSVISLLVYWVKWLWLVMATLDMNSVNMIG
jgi:hypothetical protein